MSEEADDPMFAGYGELLATALRWSWLIVLGAVVGGLMAFVLTPEGSEHSAIARVGLTTEVRWPFFDAARQRVSGIADGTDLGEIEAELTSGGRLLRAEVDGPGEEAYLNIEVWAEDPQTALEGADLYADHLVDEDTDLYRDFLDTGLATLDEQIAGLEQEIEAAEQQVDRLQAEELATQRALDAVRAAGSDDDAALAALRTAQDELDVAQRVRDQELQRRADLVEDRDGVQTVIDRDRSRVEVIRRAVPATAPIERGTQALLAGVITGIAVAVAAAWLLERQLGRVNSEASLREILGSPAIDSRTPKGWTRTALRIAGLHDGPGAIIGIAGRPAVTRKMLNRLAAEAETARLSLLFDPQRQCPDPLPDIHTRLVHAPASIPDSAGVLELHRAIDDGRNRLASATLLVVVELGEPDDDGWFELALGICDAVVVATNGRVRPPMLRRIRATVEGAGGQIDLGVLAEAGRPPVGPDPDWGQEEQ